jgi:hypothetical protein
MASRPPISFVVGSSPCHQWKSGVKAEPFPRTELRQVDLEAEVEVAVRLDAGLPSSR